jgi:hypothetical protein
VLIHIICAISWIKVMSELPSIIYTNKWWCICYIQLSTERTNTNVSNNFVLPETCYYFGYCPSSWILSNTMFWKWLCFHHVQGRKDSYSTGFIRKGRSLDRKRSAFQNITFQKAQKMDNVQNNSCLLQQTAQSDTLVIPLPQWQCYSQPTQLFWQTTLFGTE